MNDASLVIFAIVAILWIVTLLLPWQTNEVMGSALDNSVPSRDDKTVVVPARNEAHFIATTTANAGQ